MTQGLSVVPEYLPGAIENECFTKNRNSEFSGVHFAHVLNHMA